MQKDAPTGGARLSRRRALSVAAQMTAMGAVAASPGGIRRLATLTPQNTVIQLHFQANNQGTNWNQVMLGLDQQFVNENFNSTHRGVRAIVDPAGWGNIGQQIAASIAGTGYDDVWATCCGDLAAIITSGWGLPLDGYLRQDNLPRTLWSTAHMDALNVNGQQMGIPSYDGPPCVAYRQDTLDSLGLAYPEPDWTYEDALKIWSSCTGPLKDGHWRYGLRGLLYGPNHWQVWIRGWGGRLANAAGDRFLANTPEVYPGVEFPIHLVHAKISNPNGDDIGSLRDGHAVFSNCGGWDVYPLATGLPGVKWNLLPMPKWKAQQATYGNLDFYAINRATKHPDLAWELVRWLTAEPDWQRFQMRTTLVQPCLLSLWDEWVAIARNAAPVLRDKHIEYYKDAAVGGYAYPPVTWRYASSQALQVIGKIMGDMMSLKVSVPLGMGEMQRQVDALEVAGESEAAAISALNAAMSRYEATAAASKTPIHVAPPPRTGPGVAPVQAPGLVTNDAAKGTWTIKGAGAGITGGSDGCTFAGAVWTESDGTFTCRLVAINAAGGKSIANGAKVGLMARRNLGSESAQVFLDVAAGRGMHLMTRPVDGLSLSDTGQPPSTQGTGLLGASIIMGNNSQPASNYLLRPVWLRLSLDVNVWTAYTSLDGTRWTNVGSRGVDMIGAWVGLAVTSHQSGQYIEAVFDNVAGFTPDTLVRIGPA